MLELVTRVVVAIGDVLMVDIPLDVGMRSVMVAMDTTKVDEDDSEYPPVRRSVVGDTTDEADELFHMGLIEVVASGSVRVTWLVTMV